MKTMNRNSWIGLAVALLVVGFFLFGGSVMSFFNGGSASQVSQELIVSQDSNMTQKEELALFDAVVGTGAEAVLGSTVSVHYIGRFVDGTTFDTSLNSGIPFTFQLGSGQVIKGWDQGLLGMKVGGRRTIIVPPELGYGEKGRGPIPPNATLVFDVELISVTK